MRRLLAAFGLLALNACAAPLEGSAEPGSDGEALAAPSAELAPIEQSMLLPHGLTFVVPAARPFLVLAAPTETLSASAPIELLGEPTDALAPVSSYRPLLADELPDSYVGLALNAPGTRYASFGARGEACTVEVDELGLLHRPDPDGDTGSDGEPTGANPLERAWELGAVGQLLVMRSHIVAGDCRETRYAVPASVSVRRVWTKRGEAPRALAQAAIDELRALPEWGAIQEDFAQGEDPDTRRPRTGRWDEFEGALARVTVWRDGEDRTELVLVSASTGSGCGDFGGALWALFENTPDGFIPRVVDAGANVPDHVLDVEGDGKLELFSGDSAEFDEAGEAQSVSIEVPSFRCPC